MTKPMQAEYRFLELISFVNQIRKIIIDLKGNKSYETLASEITAKTGQGIHYTSIQKIATGERVPSLEMLGILAEYGDLRIEVKKRMNNSGTVQLLIANKERELGIKEHNKRRVVTFKDIDELHERPEGTAKRNFEANKKRFIEGEDYYEIARDEFHTDLLELFGFSKFAPRGILLAESGYLMLAKSLNDDLAWDVQRQLVRYYFRAKAKQPKPQFTPRMALDVAKFVSKELKNNPSPNPVSLNILQEIFAQSGINVPLDEYRRKAEEFKRAEEERLALSKKLHLQPGTIPAGPNRIKELREAKGWSQEYLARKAKVSRCLISHLEREKENASKRVSEGICKVFEMPLEEIFPEQITVS